MYKFNRNTFYFLHSQIYDRTRAERSYTMIEIEDFYDGKKMEKK